MSNFFIGVMKMLGIETVRTTAYHPQTNGQVERYNRTMASQLRHYVADDTSRWDEFFPVITMGFGIRHFWLHLDIILIPSHALWIEYLTRSYIQNQILLGRAEFRINIIVGYSISTILDIVWIGRLNIFSWMMDLEED